MTKNLVIAICAAAALVVGCGDASSSGYLTGEREPGEPGGTTPTKSPTTSTPTNPNEAPPPGSVPPTGPGSSGSKARAYFISDVFPSISPACGSCHVSGAAGAPKFMSADASNTYQLLDQRAMITAQSSFITHKHTGAGTEPTPAQVTLLQKWIGMETQERVGQKAPEDILAKLAGCIQPADWKQAESAMRALRTTARNGENPNTCSGCANESCVSCHRDGGYGRVVGLQGDQTTDLVKQRPFINRFIGLNGTDVVPSNAVKAKADATQTGVAYSHPRYALTPQAEQAITTFVTSVVNQYKAGTCK